MLTLLKYTTVAVATPNVPLFLSGVASGAVAVACSDKYFRGVNSSSTNTKKGV